MSEFAILVESVSKSFGPVQAVSQVGLSVAPGEVYGLLGANGAGKSTLIRMIVGITQPDSGRVLICGEDLSHRLTTTKRHLGYLPEDVLPYDRLTGREYIELIAGLKEANPTQITEEIEFFELGPFQNKLAGSYSHGMRQKLGLAAAMIGAPDVLVLDEPLNGLDVEMMRKLRGRVESERTEGKAILISSHVMSFTERVCNRVGIMKAGRLVAEGSPEELREMAKMSKEPFEDVFFHWA